MLRACLEDDQEGGKGIGNDGRLRQTVNARAAARNSQNHNGNGVRPSSLHLTRIVPNRAAILRGVLSEDS